MYTIGVDCNDFWGDFTFRSRADLLSQFRGRVPDDNRVNWFSLFVESTSGTEVKKVFVPAGTTLAKKGGMNLGDWLSTQKIP